MNQMFKSNMNINQKRLVYPHSRSRKYNNSITVYSQKKMVTYDLLNYIFFPKISKLIFVKIILFFFNVKSGKKDSKQTNSFLF